jgi:hypothetical protein
MNTRCKLLIIGLQNIEERSQMSGAPYMYWVGMNTHPDTSPDELAKFNDFYSNTHMREVVSSNPGFIRATRYELCEQDARGNFGPRWLAAYEMEDEDAAKGYIARNDGPPEGRPSYSPGPAAWQNYQGWWRLLWRRKTPLEGQLSPNTTPYLYFVAMDEAPGTDEQGLREFNEFYTNVHVPEVVGVSDFVSGARYELYREFRHPEPRSPGYLAVYEANDQSLKTRADRAANPGAYKPLSSGPPSWEGHVTAWRLMYRRLDSWEK